MSSKQGYVYVPYIIETSSTIIVENFSPKKIIASRYGLVKENRSQKVKKILDNMNTNTFPSRKEILESMNQKFENYQSKIFDEIKSVDIEKVDFNSGNFKARTEIIEKQKVFTWMRIFLKEQSNVKKEDIIRMEYLPTGEYIDVQFICYAKKGVDKDSNDIINYTSEEDPKILCAMTDMDKINVNNEDIPFIKTLFKNSNWFEYQLLKNEELKFTVLSNNESLEFYDVEF